MVERHIIRPGHRLFKSIDEACFASKNLYNLANYTIRQEFFASGNLFSYETLYHKIKGSEAYTALPRKVSQQVLMQLRKDWESWKAARKAYKKHPQDFLGRPRLPGYKDKTQGRNLLVYTLQAISRPGLRKGLIIPSGLNSEIPTVQNTVKQVRIVPRVHHYVVEVVYDKAIKALALDKTKIAGIDMGLGNLATVTSNQGGFVPQLINGGPLKAMNAYYNKERARMQHLLPEGQKTSKRLYALTHKRNCKVDNYLHHCSDYIVATLVAHGIGTLVIGKNEGWKQGLNLGKVTNQNFVSIPFYRLIEQIQYKAALVGMEVILTEESYTSKCSLLDLESLEKHESYAGKRVHRGLYRSGDGHLLNADVNGSGNIIRKVFPNAFADGIQGVVVRPVRVTPYKLAI